MNLLEIVGALKAARENEARTKAAMEAVMKRFQESDEWKRVFSDHSSAAAAMRKFEEDARELALSIYRQTSEKKPVAGLEVALFSTVKYTDREKVKAWARDRFKAAIREEFDWDMIDDYVKKHGAIDGTEIVEDPRVKISRNL